MKYLFPHWKEIEKKVGRKDIFLFLDYDGTLSPIVENPHKADLPEKTKNILKSLSLLKEIKLAIISGRSLNDLKSKVGINKIIYSGNHGFEVSGTKKKPKIGNLAAYLKKLKKIKEELEAELLKFKGAIVEDKKISLTFHYRMINNKDAVGAKKVFAGIVRKYADNNEIDIRRGKKVIEIRPSVEWHKGKAVDFILKEFQENHKGKKCFPVYIGDDKTDEDAFGYMQKKGLCVRVGKSASSIADFYLKNTSETAELLQRFLNLKRKERNGGT